jgi:hypothetical protein
MLDLSFANQSPLHDPTSTEVHMICQECKKLDLKSKLYPGPSYTTATYYPPFYDEDGNLHHHDGSSTVTSYECSNGHSFTLPSAPIPCFCGWPGEERKDAKPNSISIRNASG